MSKDVALVYNGILSHKKNEVMPFSAKWTDLRLSY